VFKKQRCSPPLYPYTLDCWLNKGNSPKFELKNMPTVDWSLPMTNRQAAWACGFETMLCNPGWTANKCKLMCGITLCTHTSIISLCGYASILIDRKYAERIQKVNVCLINSPSGTGKTLFLARAANLCVKRGLGCTIVVSKNSVSDVLHMTNNSKVGIAYVMRKKMVWMQNKPKNHSVLFIDNVLNHITKSDRNSDGVCSSECLKALIMESTNILCATDGTPAYLGSHIQRMALGCLNWAPLWTNNGNVLLDHSLCSRIDLALLGKAKYNNTSPEYTLDVPSVICNKPFELDITTDIEKECAGNLMWARRHANNIHYESCMALFSKLWLVVKKQSERQRMFERFRDYIVGEGSRPKNKDKGCDVESILFGGTGNKRKHFETHDASKQVAAFLQGEVDTLDCPVCLGDIKDKVAVWAECRHVVCDVCFGGMRVVTKCPVCRTQTPAEIFKYNGGMQKCVDECTRVLEASVLTKFNAAMCFASQAGNVPVLVTYSDAEVGKVLKHIVPDCVAFDVNALYSSTNPQWMQKSIERRGVIASVEQVAGRNMQGFGGIVCVGWLKKDQMRVVQDTVQRHGCDQDRINIAFVLPHSVEMEL
jgi:hypothetical protein